MNASGWGQSEAYASCPIILLFLSSCYHRPVQPGIRKCVVVGEEAILEPTAERVLLSAQWI